MERLTMTSGKGGLAFTFDLDITCDKSEINKILKLGKKLKKYEDLEEQGLIPLLHIGDNIYFRAYGMNQFGEHIDFIQTQKISKIYIDLNGILYCTASVKFIYDEVGSKVFLSREEAVEYLKSKQI